MNLQPGQELGHWAGGVHQPRWYREVWKATGYHRQRQGVTAIDPMLD